SRDEGFGLVVIEAMRAGLPVLSFASGGPAEIVTHGRDGLLVADGDVGELTEALSRLISDEELRKRMAAAAVQTSTRFEIQDIGRQWDELFHQVTPGLHQ
ncbi:MAG: glycosyltransferase, partial [Pseudonocardiaceae bacterium]